MASKGQHIPRNGEQQLSAFVDGLLVMFPACRQASSSHSPWLTSWKARKDGDGSFPGPAKRKISTPWWVHPAKSAEISSNSHILHPSLSQHLSRFSAWPAELSNGAVHALRGIEHALQLLYPEGLADEVCNACLSALLMDRLHVCETLSRVCNLFDTPTATSEGVVLVACPYDIFRREHLGGDTLSDAVPNTRL